MLKKFIIGDLIAAILIIAEIIILNLFIEKIGTVVYILLDLLLIILILFITNFLLNKGSTTKKCIINAIVLVVLYIAINGAYEKTSYGVRLNETLNENAVIDEEVDNANNNLEVSFYDADTSSQVINYGFYFVIAFLGGKLGIKNRKMI
ncbi:hypothetical protein [Candidatus Galacturonibacter soehngenii]|uniref:Uncharacterized protein n=1 Tax=Candidatus Galacturonatibacter soehngenii TaxID=2307010 RepID=A0A7V7UD63_9FIRM|nr:hypothetical protein [Candidatus Galacturonibacter soehngenii]KAB1440475.1 hypothetical protein F7O84_01170 [Candidatus Galacturonibacter soehngenii]MBA4688104.1 hypothetical protein [Candidatus Galacturonibacter soehngenii]